MRPRPAYPLLGLLLAGSLLAQQPRLQNARLESRAASGGLQAVFRSIAGNQTAPAWIGYAVPVVAGEHQMCCFSSDSCCGGCRLEDHGAAIVGNSQGPATVLLEGATDFFVLFRVEQKQVTKIRSFSADCTLDAGGLPFFWLTGVRPAESVALLASFAKADDGTRETERLANSALSAIAMHREEPVAVNALAGLAKEDKSPRVRGQALFWLAQRAGRQISEAAIREAIENDPDTGVKRRAVFALTQIPHGDGVPLLIEVARTNRNAAVRKQAMFWLGQSKDPRAVQFFEEILTSKR